VVLTQVGFVVAFGVLLDTLLVRSVLLRAAVLDLGRRVWLPLALAHGPEQRVRWSFRPGWPGAG
jgi:RND superfamily putative drug exporter